MIEGDDIGKVGLMIRQKQYALIRELMQVFGAFNSYFVHRRKAIVRKPAKNGYKNPLNEQQVSEGVLLEKPHKIQLRQPTGEYTISNSCRTHRVGNSWLGSGSLLAGCDTPAQI